MDEFAQFRATFFQECDELLGGYEEIVSRIGHDAIDREDADALFRAAHSIKAGAGAFGFTRVVRFTHEFESVLDLLRAGRLDLGAIGVDLLLAAGDVLHELLTAARSGATAREGAEAAAMARFSALMGTSALIAASPAAPPANAGKVSCLIHFRPHRSLYESANEPQLLLRALAALGECEVTFSMPNAPSLDALDPADSFAQFEIRLDGAPSIVAVREIFDFVEDDCDLSIEEITAPLVAPAREQSAVEESRTDASSVAPPAAIRVDLERVDRLVDMVGELVVAQAVALDRLSAHVDADNLDVLDAIHDLTIRTRQLQEGVMAVRMQPLKALFTRYPRIVRDLARSLGKSIKLEVQGEATEVDKTIIEEIADPLTHMIRNAIDHGVEFPEARRAAGKNEAATITLSAEQRNGRILVRVRDDGKGLDPHRIREKAIAKGLVAPDASLSKEEMESLIFLPGFSTAAAVSDLSGRGVGMDVVRRNIQRLGGRVSVESTFGQGSVFTIALPLTLAVMDGMLISAGSERYILPLATILETICPATDDMRRLPEGGAVLNVRGEVIRLVDVGRVLRTDASRGRVDRRLVICCEMQAGGKVGLVVDEILGQTQVVVKPIEANYRTIEGVSGTAVLGDGRVRLILDVDGLVDVSNARERAQPQSWAKHQPEGAAA